MRFETVPVSNVVRRLLVVWLWLAPAGGGVAGHFAASLFATVVIGLVIGFASIVTLVIALATAGYKLTPDEGD